MPKLQGDTRKRTVITVNLSEKERALIVKAAALSRRSMSQFCLMASLTFAGKVIDAMESDDGKVEFLAKGNRDAL